MTTALEPRSQTLDVNGLRVHYLDWGNPGAPPIVCVHGYTSSAQAFNALARRLPSRDHVIAPDVRGHGESAWSTTGAYQYSDQVGDLAAIVDKLGLSRFTLVGTSMGGIIAMAYAGAHPDRLTRLVINDVGPLLEGMALTRIGEYVGLDPKFDSYAQLEQHIRTVSAPFGPLTDAQWRRLSETTTRRLPDGRYALNFDPGIAVPFRANKGVDADLWPIWDAIQCPTLLLRGVESDLLSAATAAAMQQRGPQATLVELPGIGHAPALQDPSQVEIVARFLDVDVS